MSDNTPARVLLVEDQEMVRETLVMLIEMLDHPIVATETAEEALPLLDQQAFDVLIADLTLPGMSGLDLLREAAKRQPKLRLVLSSGYGAVDEAQKQGLDIVMLPKPVDNDRLIALLNEKR